MPDPRQPTVAKPPSVPMGPRLVGSAPRKIDFRKIITDTLLNCLAPSTQANYRSTWKQFLAFCDAHHVPQKFRFPADEMVLCAFAASHARISSGGTAANRIAGLKTWHALANMAWNGGPRLAYVLRGVKNLSPSSSKKPPRPPVSAEMIQFLHDNLDLDSPKEAAIFAVAAVCFWGQCRLGELLASSRQHTSDPNLPTLSSLGPPVSKNGSRELHLPRTKTNQKNGETIIITRQAKHVDPLRALALLLQANGKHPQRTNLFAYRSAPNGEFRALTKEAFISKCNAIWSGAGFPLISGHCFRIGGTTELLKLGLDAELVKSMGRWKSDSFHIYWRSLGEIAARKAEFAHKPHKPPQTRQKRPRQRLDPKRHL
ncbi:hypothetical protein RSAG8_10810, partial [Rhizoctonia solani AG-8 WAC10335]